MVLWTLEKGFLIVLSVTANVPNGGSAAVQILWWCVFMHAFYLAFSRRTEASSCVPVSRSVRVNGRRFPRGSGPILNGYLAADLLDWGRGVCGYRRAASQSRPQYVIACGTR